MTRAAEPDFTAPVRRIAPLLFALAALVVSRSARADFETWIWTELRLPIVHAPRPTFPRLDWRVFTDARFARRADGLAQAFFRTGPLLFVSDWMFIALHATVYADRLKTGMFDQEVRAEVEPNLFGRLGDFTINDRNRFEYRWRASEVRTRYRNQLRVNYAPKGAQWIPFVWDEVLIDLSGLGVHQNRAEVGLGRMLNEHIRLDLGFMARSRKEMDGTWNHDGIVNLYIFVDVPPPAK